MLFADGNLITDTFSLKSLLKARETSFQRSRQAYSSEWWENKLSVVSQMHKGTSKQEQNIFYYNFHCSVFGLCPFYSHVRALIGLL